MYLANTLSELKDRYKTKLEIHGYEYAQSNQS